MLCRIFYFSSFFLFCFYLKVSANEELIKKGEYIFKASGGCSCHTDFKNNGIFLAGGRSIETPFGTFFGSNITPDIETGIGSWSDEDFIRAMTKGISPEGKIYFPVFPYSSFQIMNRSDLIALKEYIFSVYPVNQKNTPHKLILPIGRKIPMIFWKKFVWESKKFENNTKKNKSWNRGAYLVDGIAHCGECHTPRNILGGLNYKMNLAGSIKSLEGELAPNITPDYKNGIGSWSKIDITYFLQTGIKPNGDITEGLMGEIIELGYQYYNEEDLNAIADYLKNLPQIENNLKIKPKKP